MLKYQPMGLQPEVPQQDIIEWAATQNRLMKAGLRNHDEETVVAAYDNITDRLSEAIAERFFVLTAFWMIEIENFSFVEE